MPYRAARAFLLFIAIGTLAACATVPEDYPREPSFADTATADTPIGQFADEWSRINDGFSGFYPLTSGTDAFGARLRLIELAERAIDAQYFLMKNDDAGRIFAEAFMRAADRGVKIRFLLDDVFTTVDDHMLAMLDHHPMIEVRLYNPISRRGIFYANFMGDFKRANRRMHNKSFTVDNRITVVGGRNIADEYFELRHDAEFLDFDVLVAGPAAAEVNETFDEFWNDERSFPITVLDEAITEEAFAGWRADLDAEFYRNEETIYKHAVNSQLVHELFERERELYPAAHQVITDSPAKLSSEISEGQQALVNYLADVTSGARSEVIVITPYFVPYESGVAYWESLVDRGIRVIVLTNSLASNNHTAVHSGYSRHRKASIEAGIELYEARVDAVDEADGADQPEVLTLHTKAVVIDRQTLFAGSLNMDPRSIEINSELGIVIDSAEMVAPLANEVVDDLSRFAYRVKLDENGKLTWHGTIDDQPVIETKEPQTSGWRRFQAWLLKIVPDSQL
jgi:putative cardiolipin synthase